MHFKAQSSNNPSLKPIKRQVKQQQRQGNVTELESHHLIITEEAKFNSTVQFFENTKKGYYNKIWPQILWFYKRSLDRA